VRGGDGYAIARDILESGRALAQMNAIIDAQGAAASTPEPAAGRLSFEAVARDSGVVTSIDNLQIARIAPGRRPHVQGAGVDLLRKLGDPVAAGDVLYRVHAGFGADLEFARQACRRSDGYQIGAVAAVPHVFVES
jgi:thymidine phosphorylase